MSDNTERARAVQERMTQRRDAASSVTRFGRSGQRKAVSSVRRGPIPDVSRAAAEAASRRAGASDTSRFGRFSS